MKINRALVLFFLAALSSFNAQAGFWKRTKPASTAATEARNETADPGFSRHLRDAYRITSFLDDALLLSTAQRHAVARCTAAERRALALAATDADIAQAQCNYLTALRQVLAMNQLHSYVLLCQRLAGTVLPLDGTELAVLQ